MSFTGEDHCRIGSLETFPVTSVVRVSDHCRIGSLEKIDYEKYRDSYDHCRIGSLEKSFLVPYARY